MGQAAGRADPARGRPDGGSGDRGTGKPETGLGEFSGEFVAKAGKDALLTLIAADQAPLVVPSAAEVRERREASEQAWRRWCETVPYQGEDRELVLRSVLALKLLTYSPTGAMAAAAPPRCPNESAATATMTTGTGGSAIRPSCSTLSSVSA